MTYKEFIQNILDTRGRFACGEEYRERHHIVPKCMGGNNDESNLIDLYAREHFVAHQMLAQENPSNNGLKWAWWNMCQCPGSSKKREEVAPEEYEAARINFIKSISGEGNPFFGRNHSEETKERWSKIRKNVPCTAHQKEILSQKMKGRTFSKGHKEKISTALRGQKISEDAKYKMSLAKKGLYDGDKNPRAKKVVQYSKDGKVIKVWDYIKQASKELDIGASQISRCCKHVPSFNSAGGYFWEYYLEELE